MASEQRIALLRALPGFERLPEGELRELAPRLQELWVDAGAVLVREGEPGDRCFFVVSGRAEISLAADGKERPLADVGPGGYFGELALVLASGRRQATVTALSEMQLLSLDGASFRELLARHGGTQAALEQHAEQLLRARFLEEVGAFAQLSAKERERLAGRVVERSLAAGELVICEGEIGDSCYLLRSGSVEVFVTREGREQQVDQLRAGALFGEASLISGAPRNASVRALEPLRLLELPRSALLEVSASDEHVNRELVQLLRLREFPRRAPGVELHERVSATGDETTVLKNPRLGSYYRLSPRGRFVWERLDGEHNLRRITLAYLQRFGEFAPQFVADVIGGLARGGFAEVSGIASEPPRQRSRLSRWWRLAASARRLLEWQVAVPGSDRFFTGLYRGGVRLLFTRVGLLAMLALSTVGLGAFLVVGRHAAHLLAHAHGELLLFLYPGLVLSVAIHEAGHAFATKAFGRTVQGAGVGWYWFGPIAFVDTSDMWLGTRAQRIVVSLAGPAADFVTAGAVSIVALLVSSPAVAAGLWSLTLPLYFGVVLNLNPLLEYDGYHILTDLLDRPNLRAEALAWVRRAFPGLLRSPRRAKGHWLELAYGVGSLLYVAAMAALTVIFYRLVFRRLVDAFLPGALATALAWAFAAVVVALSAGAAVADLRKLEESRDRLT